MVVSTRDRILDAAMELFGRNGYKGTSITAIESAVDLTPGAGESPDTWVQLIQRQIVG